MASPFFGIVVTAYSVRLQHSHALDMLYEIIRIALFRLIAIALCVQLINIPNYASVFTGAVFVILPVNVGPKEVHRRILQSKPACVVAASCDIVNSELLNVVDQVCFKLYEL